MSVLNTPPNRVRFQSHDVVRERRPEAVCPHWYLKRFPITAILLSRAGHCVAGAGLFHFGSVTRPNPRYSLRVLAQLLAHDAEILALGLPENVPPDRRDHQVG